MRVQHIKSDFSQEESHYFTEGTLLIGTSNYLTDLFKCVGRYIHLKEHNQLDKLSNYLPTTDRTFEYENKGYTEIRKHLMKQGYPISRKYIKNISRKWQFSRIVLSYDTAIIINELLSYIRNVELLRITCARVLPNNLEWSDAMPIQFDFLGERTRNRHNNWDKARDIVMGLGRIDLGE